MSEDIPTDTDRIVLALWAINGTLSSICEQLKRNEQKASRIGQTWVDMK